jgi:CHAT domain-containing protein/tetratricopeptide (TPR) repeat protein
MRAKLPERKNVLKGFAVFSHNNMERVEKEGKNLEEREAIKDYLLGTSSNEAEMRKIEEKILLDDNFEEKLAVAEDELIDKYLDDSLTESERERFTRFFLNAPERKEKLRLIRSIKEYAVKSEPQIVRQFPKQKGGFLDWRRLFSMPSFRLAAAALLILAFGFIIWRAVFYQSDVDKGLAQLQMNYSEERPVEVRIAGFNYAPLRNTRDAGDNKIDTTRAQGFLLHAAAESRTAEALHALGKFYLTEKKFDEAIKQFEKAAALTSDNAQLQSDWGAALLEMGKKALLEQERAKGMELLNESLKHFEKAIALDSRLLEPRFNRALCLQTLLNLEQAKQAWREYLELDSNSKWAEEARRKLQLLEAQKIEDLSAADLERDFLLAMHEKNDARAWQLLSRNRELIREKYLPQRLAMSYLEAKGDEKKDFLAALEYAGELEKAHIGDSFAAEIAQFYKILPEDKFEVLKKAQNAVRDGYKLCLKPDFKSALEEFTAARELFLQLGDVWETKLSEYSIAYSLINLDRMNESNALLTQVVEFSQNRKYKWLEATSLHWLGGSHKALKQRTQAKRMYEKALALAEDIKDSYAIQRNLVELAKHSSFVGQKQTALNYLRQVLEESDAPDASLRQKYRNYAEALQILTAAKLYNAAKPIALEAVWLADKIDDPLFRTLSRNNAGIACAQTGDFDSARKWLNDGKEKAEIISNELSRKRMIAYSFLKSGYVEKEAGNYEKSGELYDAALSHYSTMEMPTNLYEAQKGKLHAYLALGKNAALEELIPATVRLIEDYREKILEEQERTSFFDAEESIYDIAVDYEFGQNRFERAYDYAEISNSRSLLDWLQKGAKTSEREKNLKILLEENANPLTLVEIRQQMPARVQVLQYSVLENKILIWLVSKEKFSVVAAAIKADELSGKVENYVKLLQQKNDNARTNAARLGGELYELLIAPILNQIDSSKDICIIPNKILFYLPFAALIAPDGNPFLKEFNIFYAPSANVFLLCTENAQEKVTSNETLLSVGSSAFDRSEFDNLSDLPAAETEAQEIAEFYDEPQKLLGKKATKTAFMSLMKSVEIIHFAGHYVVKHEAPLSSSLLLAKSDKDSKESILTNAELVGEKLPRVKLVVLSACQTGVEYYYNGEGLIGLSRTFLATGAPLVVASQWSVDSDATAQLMKQFHFYRRKEKMTTTNALRRAQLEMLNEPNGRFREPYYWAAFAAFGGYANF